MPSRRVILTVLGLGVVAAAWYAFRPERAFIDRRVNEPAPAGPTTVILAGQFGPREHDGRGTAQVLALADGRRVLHLTDFETLNGPDLQVYLLGDPAAASRDDLTRAGYLSLGALKGNVGPQSYDVPAGADLSRYRAVSVWCRRFGVNFTTAPLAPPATESGEGPPGTR
jgi:hypothetical protein